MNVSCAIKTSLSTALLAGLFATGAAAADRAQPVVYGGYTATNGVILPVDLSAYASEKQGFAASPAGSRVFGVFERDSAGVTVLSATAVRGAASSTPLITASGSSATGLVYGDYRNIDGVTLPASRAQPAAAPDIANVADVAIAARDPR